MYIFITGCAKSGTTLLQRLFNYYKNTKVIPGEISLDELITRKNKNKIIVGKRVWNTVLSNEIEDKLVEKQISLIKTKDVKIVNIIRDGRDVVTSDNGWVKPIRWIYSIRQREELGNIITAEVRYEDLVSNPDVVQEYISDKLGIKVKHKFSDYPKHLRYEDFSHLRGNDLYKARPISNNSIGKDLEAYKYLCSVDELLEFNELLNKLGYK